MAALDTYVLWSDVPQEKRVNREFLENRAGADRDDGEQWVQRKLRTIENPRCKMAVRWSTGEDFWTPCAHPPIPGEDFCPFHGGSKKVQPLTAQQRKERFLLRKLETARRRKKNAEEYLAQVLDEVRRWEQDVHK